MEENMNKVKLVAITKPVIEDVYTAEELVAFCARVSNPENQNNKLTAKKLLKYLMDNKHWSPFEMVNVVMEIETTRDIGRQLLRHRSFSFQEFCIDQDSLITCVTKSGSTRKVKIKDLYKRQQSKQYSSMSDWGVRIYNEQTNLLEYSNIKEVFYTGSKPCYKIKLDNGKELICTEDHKILTNFKGEKSFNRLCDITTDYFVATNGIPVYRSKEWLQEAKDRSIEAGKGLYGIAEEAGCKPVTISKWLRVHQIQFTKKEVSSYAEAWNKGLDKEKQPRYGKFLNEGSREKMRNSSRKNEKSNLYKHGKFSTENNFRVGVVSYCKGFHTQLLNEQNFKCAACECNIDRGNSDVDHKLPIYSHPHLGKEKTNLQILCRECHYNKSREESLSSKYTIRWSKVKSIEFVGSRETYDMEINHTSHNYISNGIVTHNSQRYQEVSSLGFVKREARLQDSKNRQNSVETSDQDLKDQWDNVQDIVLSHAESAYNWALEKGIAKEQARCILPEGLTMSRLYVNGTLRSWIHYCQLRMENGTQKEHRELAEMCWNIIVEKFPSLFDEDK